MAQRYDAIVLGLGAMGSASVAHLAQRGASVLGLDAFDPHHTFGSSHGRSRIIREAYFEDPEYVPLVQRAYALWRELESTSDEPLLTITGGLNIGTRDSGFVSGAMASVERYQLTAELLSAREIAERFPGFQLPDSFVAVYEPHAGYLRPEECNDTHRRVATDHGADLRWNEPALEWSVDNGPVTVRTQTDRYEAERLIITAGPWTAEVDPALKPLLTVQRIVNVHFEPSRPELFAPEHCPVYLFQVPEGDYYGFPALPGEGVKFGRHDVGEICTPETIRREVDGSDIEPLRQVLERYLPGSTGKVLATLTCMYTNTPDRHFIIDQHPDHPEVIYGCGFSGHGYKFASAIGEVLTQLALDGASALPVDFLSARRFSAS